ncbi:MAG TPA: hypothetical protein VF486_03850 [Actinomycetes bacterium]
MEELLERWFEWRQAVRPISPTTVMSYLGDPDRYILPDHRGAGTPDRHARLAA